MSEPVNPCQASGIFYPETGRLPEKGQFVVRVKPTLQYSDVCWRAALETIDCRKMWRPVIRSDGRAEALIVPDRTLLVIIEPCVSLWFYYKEGSIGDGSVCLAGDNLVFIPHGDLKPAFKQGDQWFYSPDKDKAPEIPLIFQGDPLVSLHS